MLLIKEKFLDHDEVKKLTKYLVSLIDGLAFSHKYNIVDSTNNRNSDWIEFNNSNEEWKINSLENAFQKYYWQGGYSSNKRNLDKLKNNLRDSFKKYQKSPQKINSENEIKFMGYCRDILKWGGVLQNNTEWLVNKITSEHGLIHAFSESKKILSSDELKLTDKDWSSNNSPFRMNAGYTKIFSLLCDDFIIYDSRVAAALGNLIIQCNKGHVPDVLKIKVMKARGNQTRNLEGFTENTNNTTHAEWNVKLNWILSAAIDSCKNNWSYYNKKGEIVSVNDKEMFRALEAALFMIGYDIPMKLH